MYLLYLDESGQHGGEHFVLAGAAVFEQGPYWIAEELDKLQDRFFPQVLERVELHASVIRAGKVPPWDSLDMPTRHQILDAVYGVIASSNLVLFGVVIHRPWLTQDQDEYAFAFESLLSRFDAFLKGKYRQENDPQRGIVIIAESEYRHRLESIALRLRDEGTRWGRLSNLAEIPLFTLASNSRMLQVADFCANAIYARYEHGYARHFDRIGHKFDKFLGALCGLGHFSQNFADCNCPACLSRRLSSQGETGASHSPEPGR